MSTTAQSPLLLDAVHCIGCVDDFYNGKNDLGVTACWHRSDAKLEPCILIHVDAMPPYRDLKIVKRPTCYKKSRFVTVKPEAIGKDGYRR